MLCSTLASLALIAATPAAAQAVPCGPALAPEFRLHGDTVTLPFVMVREFPFVEAEVNGVKGKLMLDTGSADALSLDQNHIQLPEGRAIGTGNFGSGQTFKLFLRPRVDKVRLAGGLTYGPITLVKSQDAAQLEHITPDFLGWLGYWFWDGYAMKLDYRASRATFYKGGPKAFLKGEKIVAALPFELRKLPNHPVMTTLVGDTKFQTVFDTGQYGNLYTDDATLTRLTAAGDLTAVAGEDNRANIRAVHFSNGQTLALARFATHTTGAPFATPIGLDSGNILSLGYGFLSQFKTVWDFPNKTLYLLRK